MNSKNNKDFALILSFSVFIFVLFSVSVLPLVSAGPGNATGLIINQNVTAVYDEGDFWVNWTKPVASGSGGNSTDNYTIYIAVDGNHFATADNDSLTGYHFSNTTQGNYTFTIQAINGTDGAARGNSTSNISIFVDSTVPTVTLHTSFSNATAKKNTNKLTLNISVADANSGLTGSNCLVDVNGTNQTITASSGWCNNTNINLTSSSDDVYQMTIWVNDTVGNLGNNNTRYIIIDTTNPSSTASCSPSSVIKGSTLECTCSGSDATSGVSTTTADESITATGTGSFDFACTVTDQAGNSAENSFTYTVTGGSGGSSGGGGGGSGTASSIRENIFTQLTPGAATIVKNFDAETGVREISVEVNNKVNNVKITVSKYDEKPAEVSVEKSGRVYQYVEITPDEELRDNLNKATITFRAEKSWASENSVEKENIVISRFNERTEEWNELDTTYKEEDDTHYYYDVELTEFSYFAIAEKEPVVEEEENGVTTIIGDIGKETKDKFSWWWVVVIILLIIAVKYASTAVKKRK